MASLIDFSSTNWSYYTIPAAFFLVMAPNFYAVALAGKNYDIAYPRTLESKVATDSSLPKPIQQRISRARAAAANGFETIGLYAAAVVAANSAQVPTEKLNKLTLTYIVSRAVYNFVYVALQENRKLAGLRPLVWGVGITVIMMLFVSAGQALNA